MVYDLIFQLPFVTSEVKECSGFSFSDDFIGMDHVTVLFCIVQVTLIVIFLEWFARFVSNVP
jgi:hypothetical protein